MAGFVGAVFAEILHVPLVRLQPFDACVALGAFLVEGRETLFVPIGLLRVSRFRVDAVEEPAQRRGNLRHRFKAIGNRFREHLQTDRIERRVNVGSQFRRQRRLAVENLPEDRSERAFKRQPSGQQFKQNHAQAVDVRSGAKLPEIVFPPARATCRRATP